MRGPDNGRIGKQHVLHFDSLIKLTLYTWARPDVLSLRRSREWIVEYIIKITGYGSYWCSSERMPWAPKAILKAHISSDYTVGR